MFRRKNKRVVSFLKCGRTWLQLMTARVYSQRYGLKIDGILNFVATRPPSGFDRRPFIGFTHGYDYKALTSGSPNATRAHYGEKLAVLVRDPRDVIVSNYHWQKYSQKKFSGSLHEFVHYEPDAEQGDPELFFFGVRSIIRYFNSWVAHREKYGPFHVISYESMKADPTVTLANLFQFFGDPLSAAELVDAIAFGSFENMRHLEQSGAVDWYGLPGGADPRGRKTRSGKVGGAKESLSDEDFRFVDQLVNDELDPFFSKYVR